MICHSGERKRLQNQSDAGPDFARATTGKASQHDKVCQSLYKPATL
jgi:hypothetical protein